MSIELINKTPYLATAWDYLNANGEAYGVSLIRGCFLLKKDPDSEQWQLQKADDQGEIFSQDQFNGEPGKSSLQYETDYVSYKSGTDIIANATARTPKGVKKPFWGCGIKVTDGKGKTLINKILRVSGKRIWKKNLVGWSLEDPVPCKEVKIRYENTYGGAAIKYDKNGEVVSIKKLNKYNPVGVGNIHYTDTSHAHIAPQIESLDEPLGSALDESKPHGFGFIARGWQPRLALAGTYDEKWLKEKHPLLPDDFNIEHNRSASTGMALPYYLKGGEKIILKHFLFDDVLVSFKLPSYRFLSGLVLEDGGPLLQPLELDTVLLDIEHEDIEQWRIYLSWRGQHILPITATHLELFGINEEENKNEENI